MYVTGEQITNDELTKYREYVKEHHPGKRLAGVHIEDGYATLKLERPPFERIRRITGYLVGSSDRWSDAKAAELSDRVKHGGEAGQ